MNNLSEIRKQFAKTYGIPAGNCKDSRHEEWIRGVRPLLVFLIADFVCVGIFIAISFIKYFPKSLDYILLLDTLAIFLLLFGAYLLNKLMKKTEAEMTAYDVGIEGENAVAAELTFLPPEYVVFHSVNLPDCKWDIDHIVLSPYGIILIETKKWNTLMEYKDGKLAYDRKAYPKDPLEQLKGQAISLKEYLEGIPGIGKLWIQGTLCLVGQELKGIPEFLIDKCYVTNEKRLFDRIVNHGRPGSISEKDLGLIEGKLGELCRE